MLRNYKNDGRKIYRKPKKVLDIFWFLRIIILVRAIEDLCNGSTPDSDSVCGGSNPSSSAKKTPTTSVVGVFLLQRQGFEPI